MALEAVVESIDSVEESFRDHYVEKDGKYVLDVKEKAGFALENIEGLRSALGKERGKASEYERKLKGFGDLDPSGIQEKLQKLEELQSINPEKEADKLAEEKAKNKIDQILQKHQKDLDEVSSKANTYKSKLEKVLIDNTLQKALLDAGGNSKTVELLAPHMRSKVVLDQDFNQQVVDSEGNPRIGDSQGQPMTLKQLAKEFKEKYPEAFPGTQQSGGGTPPTGRSKAGRPKDLSKLTTAEKSKLINEIGYQSYIDLVRKQGG